jgi:O-antigen/teichoic acid export membrane protein
MGAGVCDVLANDIASLPSRLSVETRGLAKDTAMLSIGKAATVVGMTTQVALITHVLGLTKYGVFALTVSFVALVDKFFDVDVTKAALAFGARSLRGDPTRLAGVFQLSYLIDGLLGIVGFTVVAIASPFVGPWLVGDQGTLLFLLYGFTLLASTVDGSSQALLQLLDRYSLLTGLVVLREALRVVLVVAALLTFHSLVAVMIALVLQDALVGLTGTYLAVRAFRKRFRANSLLHSQVRGTRPIRRDMLGMVFQTNIIGYGRLTEAQLPALIVGAFAGPLEAGIFKLGMAGAAAIGQVSDPAWNAVMPRLARLWSDARIADVRRLVRQATAVAAAAMLTIGTVAILLRIPILRAFGGAEATAAATVFSLGVIAKVVNGVFFWNDSLLYAAGRARLVRQIYLPSVAVMLVLCIMLAKDFGANGAAVGVLVSAVLANVGFALAAGPVLASGETAELRRKTPAPMRG